MEKREKVTVGVGAAIVAVVLLSKAIGGGGAVEAGSVEDSITRIERFEALDREVRIMTADLGLEVPQTLSGAEQEVAIVNQLGELAQKNGLKLGGVRKVSSSARRRGAGSAEPVEWSYQVEGPFEGLMKYVWALEHATLPFRIQDFNVSGEKGNRQGKITAHLTVRSYLFPEGRKPPQPEEKKEEHPSRERRGGDQNEAAEDQAPDQAPAAAGAPTPGQQPRNEEREKKDEDEKQQEAPAAEEEDMSHVARLARGETMRVSAEGHEVTVRKDGDQYVITTPDGEEQTMSAEEFESALEDGLPEGAEVSFE